MMPGSTVSCDFISKTRFRLAFLVLILLTFALAGCSDHTRFSQVRPRSLPPGVNRAPIASETNRLLVNNILKTAFSQFGTPYRYGGNSPETGFDCSGFVSWVYKQYGINLPRSSRDMLAIGTPISQADLRPGDLVFFNYGYSHVGIYTGNNKYIHSPSSGKRIQESDINGTGRRNHYVGARRIIDNRGITNIADNLKADWVKQSRHQTTLNLTDTAANRHTGARANYSRSKGKSSQTASRSKGKNTQTASQGKGKNTQTASRGKGKNSVSASRTHQVASGDTIYDLSRKYGVSSRDLVAFNNMSNGNKLKPGQTIKIPESAKAQAKGKQASATTASAKGKVQPKAKASGKTTPKAKTKAAPKAKTKAAPRAKVATKAKSG
jgi:LysM repeat protein